MVGGVSVGYGRWQRLEEALAPEGPGLLQVRFDQGPAGLVAYPTGKSAMAYFDADDVDVARALARARARAAAAAPGTSLWVRFAAPEAARLPSDTLARALERFRARFGAPPRLHAEWE